jgi:hypothetical protein
MFDRFDPRDHDHDPRDDYGIYDPRWNHDARERDEDEREGVRDRDRDRERDPDPRDPFVEGLDLPRGLEVVLDDRDRTYELNGEDSRTLAAVGVFRVVAERPRDDSFDSRDNAREHLRDQGLLRSVSLDGRERVLTLTERGRSLLEGHRRERHDERDHQDERRQALHAGVSRPRVLVRADDLLHWLDQKRVPSPRE